MANWPPARAATVVTVPRRPRRLRGLAERWLAGRASRIVVSGVGQTDARTWPEALRDKLAPIPSGAAPAATPGPTRAELLNEFELPADVTLIATCQRLAPPRRTREAIWATDILTAIYDNVHMILMGEGPEFESLLRFRNSLDRWEHIRFCGLRLDAPGILGAVDQVWLPGGRHGFEQAALEAMAAGVPVVASDTPAHCELIEHDATGLLYPLGDRPGLAKQAKRLIDDPQLAQRLGNAGREAVLRRYDAQTMIDRHVALYDELYDELCDASPARPKSPGVSSHRAGAS